MKRGLWDFLLGAAVGAALRQDGIGQRALSGLICGTIFVTGNALSRRFFEGRRVPQPK